MYHVQSLSWEIRITAFPSPHPPKKLCWWHLQETDHCPVEQLHWSPVLGSYELHSLESGNGELYKHLVEHERKRANLCGCREIRQGCPGLFCSFSFILEVFEPILPWKIGKGRICWHDSVELASCLWLNFLQGVSGWEREHLRGWETAKSETVNFQLNTLQRVSFPQVTFWDCYY